MGPEASAREISGWPETRLLVRALALVAAVLAILLVWAAAGGNPTHLVDERLLLALRTPGDPADPRGPHWLPIAMRDFSALGGDTVLLLFTAVVAGFLAARRQYHAMALVLVAGVGADVLTALLKDLFDRPRPQLVSHLVTVTSPSFPSGHALSSAVVYPTLASLLCRVLQGRALRLYVMSVALLLTFLAGLSRVYLGVHYPSDVLGGWVAGLVTALGLSVLARRLQRRGVIEPPR